MCHVTQRRQVILNNTKDNNPIGPLREIIPSSKVALSKSIVATALWHVAPSCQLESHVSNINGG